MNYARDNKTVKNGIRSFFDKDSAKYEMDRWSLQEPESFYDFNATRNILEQALYYTDVRNPKVLDIGSGTGLWARQVMMLTKTSQIVCLDLSERMLQQSVYSFGDKHKHVIHVLADAEEPLPFENQNFDIILCFHALEYLLNYVSLPKEVERVLKRRGILILVTKNRRAVTWRLAKAIADRITANPLEYQRWFEPNQLLSLFNNLRPKDLSGISLRPPTRLNDLNDNLDLRIPELCSRGICRLLYPIEVRFNRLNRFTQCLFWHLCIVFQKSE